jgi:predicted SnoaL-like aldol condensation-catalyzing enzyme
MAASPHHLVEAFVAMLNEHDPDLVDRFVAADYINHNVFVPDGREGPIAGFGRAFSPPCRT